MAVIAVDVSQKATLICCGLAQSVHVRGILSARWDYNLFGDIHISHYRFALQPEIQTVLCTQCNRLIDLQHGDVEFKSGLLTPEEACSDLRYRTTAAADTSAQAAIKIALVAQGHSPIPPAGWEG